MKLPQRATLFNSVLVPIVHDCDQKSAVAAARAIAGREHVQYIGIVPIRSDESLSTAAPLTRSLRRQIRQLQEVHAVSKTVKVYVSHTPWNEVVKVVERERADLLVLEWPCQITGLRTSLEEVLARPPCDIAIVNQFVVEKTRKVLVPMRGGPYAELALRLALSINNINKVQIASLHIFPADTDSGQDAAFRGIERILRNLPEVKRQEVTTDDPASAIMEATAKYDLVVVGASARPVKQIMSIGPVAARIMENSQKGVLVVKRKRPSVFNPESEEAGQEAISVLVDKWFAENTFEADEFKDLNYLLKMKQEQGLTISLALPALNEEKTVGNVINTLQETLFIKMPLLDEIVVIDSNSSDHTRQIAEALNVPVHIHQDILREYGTRWGKGEALWKSLYRTRGDLIIWLDTDIVNIHPRFVYGLIGPLLLRPEIDFVKGFYHRPLKVGNKMQAGGGGRVTELTARPLINLFYPELSGVVQPLSGEYGGRRKVLEQLPFFSGYGVEIGLLIDVFEKFGLHAIAQVNLQQRVHHNQPLEALSKMSFAIIQAVIRKIEGRYGRNILESVNKTMKLIRYEKEHFFLDIEEIAEKERPPIRDLPEYKERFGKQIHD
jgi:glycosyltransferase involved in cell wall biosynthesis/nucleotide-binding universal stress UspA family protein